MFSIHRIGTLLLGTVFLYAAAIKSIHFEAFADTIQSTLHLPLSIGQAQVFAAGLLGFECTLGMLWCLNIKTPAAAQSLGRLTMVTLLAFSLYLINILMFAPAKGCGCLSGTTKTANATLDATLGLARNISLVALVAWLARHPPISTSPASTMKVRQSSARGFTLVELLVIIVVLALLISLTLPALSRARQAAKDTREITITSQLHTATTLYASDFKSLYPYICIETRLDLMPTINNVPLPPAASGYFKANSFFYTSLLVPTYFTDRASIDNGFGGTLSPEMIPTVYHLTYATAASSKYWTGQDPGADWNELRPQGSQHLAFPSRKGIIAKQIRNADGTLEQSFSPPRAAVAAGDGSASLRPRESLNDPSPPRNANRIVYRPTSINTPVLSTETGLSGIDF